MLADSQEEASPLTLIARLCCSIDQPARHARTTKTITDEHRATYSSSLGDQSSATGRTSFGREISSRSARQAHSSSSKQPNLHRCRRTSDPAASRRSGHIAKRHLLSLSSSSSSALDFYFRSLLATRPLAAGFDFRYRAAAAGRRRIFPTFSGSVARPYPMRPVPRFPGLLPTCSGKVGGPALDHQLSNVQFPEALGQFRSQLVASGSLPLHLEWPSSGRECDALSRDHADEGATPMTSSANSVVYHYHQQPVELHWNPSLSACLRPLPWQPSY